LKKQLGFRSEWRGKWHIGKYIEDSAEWLREWDRQFWNETSFIPKLGGMCWHQIVAKEICIHGTRCQTQTTGLTNIKEIELTWGNQPRRATSARINSCWGRRDRQRYRNLLIRVRVIFCFLNIVIESCSVRSYLGL
jgi:hypothetical protein